MSAPTTQTVTITEFLLARIAEDEAVAHAASPGGWAFNGIESVSGGMIYDETRTIAGVYYEQPDDHDGRIVRHLLSDEADRNGEHIARHDPARVLGECEAKRRIIAEHGDGRSAMAIYAEPYCRTCSGDTVVVLPCRTLGALALPYADHPDYDPTWAS